MNRERGERRQKAATGNVTAKKNPKGKKREREAVGVRDGKGEEQAEGMNDADGVVGGGGHDCKNGSLIGIEVWGTD